ncbi:YccS/YhfK family putative transporter [Citrobacter sp. JGM124]|uniref:YccS/YhfK family putative transporter n=1 Tax=Citrobacter sp. JGM124 TaxID=2799789 RepID=UPI001BA4DE43|nr:YccS/YhfK family putative transporter [Citrobacter sp. JGM124]MBS0848286.1 FUSC family protein [Citrobacter sp. JGM124]
MWRRLIYHSEVNYALRQTLLLCIPVIIGLLTDTLRYSLLFALVPVCCNLAGLDTPHRRFFRRLVIGASLFALCSLVMQLLLFYTAVPLPVILFFIALSLGICAEAGALNARLFPGSLVVAIFTLALVGNISIGKTIALYVTGTIWYGVFNWFWFRIWREQPLRESLSQLYLLLADYCEAKYSSLNKHMDPEVTLPPLLIRQQKTVDAITLCYQQLYMLSGSKHQDDNPLVKMFQIAIDLQEHISVSLYKPEEVQKLINQSNAEAVIRWNACTIANRLRTLADDILYHHPIDQFNMDMQISALEKIARQHPNNSAAYFCYSHLSRIAQALSTQKPLYTRGLIGEPLRPPTVFQILKNYCSLKSASLRNAARLGVMLAIASLLGSYLHLPKSYWILMTVMFVTQNGYGATRVRIVHRAAGTIAGLCVAGVTLHFHIPDSYTLLAMLAITLVSYLYIRRSYGWATIGFTVTTVYTLQLVALNGEQFIIPRLIDTLLGCFIAFGGMIWLWPQWQSGLLRQNAHDALSAYQDAIQLMLEPDPQLSQLSYQRMRVNQAHNALFNTFTQAMQEPGFNNHYLADMRLWVTHSQFIVEHINAMTGLVGEKDALSPEKKQYYQQLCGSALQRCQQRLDYDGEAENETPGEQNILETCEDPEAPHTVMEQHLQRILGHLSTMHSISSVAWKQRPHGWISRHLQSPH